MAASPVDPRPLTEFPPRPGTLPPPDQGRIIVTHDISTLAKHAFDRIAAGQPMPGVFEVKSVAPVGQAIDDLTLLAECSVDGEWEGRCASCPFES